MNIKRSSAPTAFHGSPTAASSVSSDVKDYLLVTDRVMAQPACNAENMPAHFKQRSELTARSSPSPSPSPTPSPSPASAAAASTVTTTSSAASSAASSLSPSISPQSVVLVPGSPPQTPPQTPRSAHDSTLPAATPSRLAKLRQNNLAKKREQMKTMKMPELSEHAEASDSELAASNGATYNPSSPSTPGPSSAPPVLSSSTFVTNSSGVGDMPHIAISGAGDGEDRCDGTTDNGGGDGREQVVRPPSPTDDPVTPSIPESFLKQLGLSTAEKELVNGEPAVDQLPDKQLESRFNSLALAFKTDRLTLEKRLGIQERSRDLAEQNIDKELHDLRQGVETLNQWCTDEKAQETISKMQRSLDILEHSVARVSSRAEVFGAVQQEKRMCLAMEVMITYTENIRRLRSTEQNEVEEAKRVLNNTRQLESKFSLDTLSIGDRRSASVCAGLNNPRTTRRRSEVALPRFFGGAGSPSLHVSSSMSSLGAGCRPAGADSAEEPRQRFQSATANVTVRNVVTNTLRRASLERQKNLSLHSSSTTSSSSQQSASTSNSPEQSQDKEQVTKQHSQEEEAYRHGYEEGLKASLSRELTDLRDQQTSISSNLEQVMDRVETLQQEDKDDADIEQAMSTKVQELVVTVREWMSNPNWQSASQTLRKVAAAVIFLIAVIIVVFTFAPLIPGNISLRNYAKSAQ